MADTEFNLIEEPWIKAVLPDGRVEEKSLMAILENDSAGHCCSPVTCCYCTYCLYKSGYRRKSISCDRRRTMH